MTNNEKLQDELSYWINLEKEGIELDKNSFFQSWINKNELNQKAFNEEKEFLSKINSLPEDFLNELKHEVKENRKVTNKKNKIIFYTSSFASAACILIITYFSFFLENTTYTHNYLASNKVQRNIVLPDNSIISLDANTSINVKFYKDKREIILSKGKAFFDVHPNKKRPFIIKTDRTITKVLGTRFEIINNKEFELNVKEGKVAISNKKNKLLALVTKNQSLKLNRKYHIKSLREKNAKDIALWNDGKFNFDQTSLKEVLNTYKRYININVKFADDNLEKLKISGNFTTEEFDKIITNLPIIHPIIIDKTNNTIIIKNKN